RLAALGVSTVVGNSEKLRAALSAVTTSITPEGMYWRAELAARPAAVLAPDDRPGGGYLDRRGRGPFQSFELIHYPRSGLFDTFSIVDLTGRAIPADALSGLVVVADASEKLPQYPIPTLELVAPPADELHHYAIPKEANPERRYFIQVEQLFLGVDWQ